MVYSFFAQGQVVNVKKVDNVLHRVVKFQYLIILYIQGTVFIKSKMLIGILKVIINSKKFILGIYFAFQTNQISFFHFSNIVLNFYEW